MVKYSLPFIHRYANPNPTPTQPPPQPLIRTDKEAVIGKLIFCISNKHAENLFNVQLCQLIMDKMCFDDYFNTHPSVFIKTKCHLIAGAGGEKRQTERKTPQRQTAVAGVLQSLAGFCSWCVILRMTVQKTSD